MAHYIAEMQENEYWNLHKETCPWAEPGTRIKVRENGGIYPYVFDEHYLKAEEVSLLEEVQDDGN